MKRPVTLTPPAGDRSRSRSRSGPARAGPNRWRQLVTRPRRRSVVRVLVTGSAGKVGARVVARLVAQGHRVTGTDVVRVGYGPPFDRVPYVRADLTDYGQTVAVV